MTQQDRAEQAGVLVLGRILSTLSEVIVPLVIVRVLDKVQVGILAEVLLIYTTVTLLLAAGFPATLLYYLPGRPAAERKAIALRVTTILAGLGALGGLLLLATGLLSVWTPQLFSFFASAVDTGQQSFVYLAGLALFPLADVPARILPNLCVVEGRARSAAWVGVVRGVGMTTAVLLPLAFSKNLWWVVGGLSGFGLLLGLLTIRYFRLLYRGVEKTHSPTSIGELFRFGLPLGLTDMVANINSRIDRFLIIFFFTEATFAEYQVGAWQIPMITSIPYLALTVYAPQLSKLFKSGKGEDAITIWRDTTTKIALLVIPITMVFVVAAEELIELLFTADYLRAADIFRLYAIVTLGRVTAYGTVLVCAGRPGYLPRAGLVALVWNVGISVPLVLILGFVGPAVGTVLAFIPTVIGYCYYISKASGVPLGRIYPFVGYMKVLLLGLVAASGAVAFKVSVTLPAAIKLGGEAMILLLTFGLIGTALGMITRSDWRFLVDWMRLKAVWRG